MVAFPRLRQPPTGSTAAYNRVLLPGLIVVPTVLALLALVAALTGGPAASLRAVVILPATVIALLLAFALAVMVHSRLHALAAEAQEAVVREAIAAQRAERRLQALVHDTADLVLVCQRAGDITWQSPAAETAWSYGKGELLGQPILELVHAQDRSAAAELWEQALMAPGETRKAALRLRNQAGNWRRVELMLGNLLHDPAVEGLVVTVRDVTHRKLFERQLTRQALHDRLTGLPNRALLQDRTAQALLRTGRRERSIGLLYVDLDQFKLINDSLGSQLGDRMLVEAAQRLRECVRPGDTVARLGGDQFGVLLEYLADEAEALSVAEAIARRFAQPLVVAERELVLTASIGVALADPGEQDGENLLRNADVAMYRAKSAGKARHVLFEPSMHMDMLARLDLETELRRALDRGELQVFYQPIVALETGRVIEAEALARWRHPAKGLVSPSEFIPVAEETGLILPLGALVLREACRQAAAWQKEHAMVPPLVMSVNISARQFQLPDFVALVARTLAETGLPAAHLKLEITESMLMQDVDAAIATLTGLKALGIQLAVDDFGTGYSSLAYLKRLPLDVLKIDQSFVRGLGLETEDTAIVRAIISLAHSLGLTVTAEGVETAEQAALLRSAGCERGQGYFFAPPLEAASIGVSLAKPGVKVA